jgi:hypothetical protein
MHMTTLIILKGKFIKKREENLQTSVEDSK